MTEQEELQMLRELVKRQQEALDVYTGHLSHSAR